MGYVCHLGLGRYVIAGYLLCNENPIYVFQEKELRGLRPNFHWHVSVSDRSTYFPAAE
jgi:hypothetical protein